MKSRLSFILASVLMLAFATVTSAQGTLTMTDRELAVAPVRNHAVVELSANFMREEPDFSAELGDQALMGTVAEVLGKEGSWVKIKTPEPYTAWVNNMGLVMMDDKELADYLEAPKYICNVPKSHIYEEPSLKSRIVSEFVMGDIVGSCTRPRPTSTAVTRDMKREGPSLRRNSSEWCCLPERRDMSPREMWMYSTNGPRTGRPVRQTRMLSARILWRP